MGRYAKIITAFKHHWLILLLQGLLHLKQRQDEELSSEHAYIRFASEVSSLDSLVYEEDDTTGSGIDPIRIAVCMGQESSRRLLKARFLQSDIGFKRIVGFQEFEIGGKDPGSPTGTFIFISCPTQA